MNVPEETKCDMYRCANNKGGGCIALTECLAQKDKICPFYKTREQANEEIIECINRKAAREKAKAKKAKE